MSGSCALEHRAVCFKRSEYTVLHYLAHKDYKPQMCKHCNSYFFTSNLKNLYCPYGSRHEDYSNMSCYEAVKKAKREIRETYRKIHKRYYSRTDNSYEEWDKFDMEFQYSLEELKNRPDYNTINKCKKQLKEIDEKKKR